MANATGVNVVASIKKQGAKGTPAVGSGGQQVRRTTFPLDYKKLTYQSAEIVTTMQVSDYRHGVQYAEGKYTDELSPGSHKLWMPSLLRRDYTVGATTGALITVAAAAGPPGTFTRSAGSFLTDGFKIGDVVSWTGWVVATANNARNYRITALTATVMTVGTAATGAAGGAEAVVVRAAGDSVTCSVRGKKTFIPTTSQTADWWTVEKWFSDIAQSELFTDCKVVDGAANLPATGLATIDFGIKGLGLTRATAQALTTPTAISTTKATAAVNGTLRAGGVDLAIVTSMSLNINTSAAFAPPTVGSNLYPDILYGRTVVTGQFTAMFADNVLRDIFVDETESTLNVTLTTDNTITADVVSITMSRIKFAGAAKSDVELAVIQTFPFVALLDNNGGAGLATENTTISWQDTAA